MMKVKDFCHEGAKQLCQRCPTGATHKKGTGFLTGRRLRVQRWEDMRRSFNQTAAGRKHIKEVEVENKSSTVPRHPESSTARMAEQCQWPRGD